jgi:hypothetical protein
VTAARAHVQRRLLAELDPVLDALLAAGKSGDVRAATEALNRLLGKAVESVAVAAEIDAPMPRIIDVFPPAGGICPGCGYRFTQDEDAAVAAAVKAADLQ